MWNITSNLVNYHEILYRGDRLSMKRRIFLMLGCLLLMYEMVQPMPTADANPSQQAFHFGFKKSKDGQLPSINEEGFKDILEKHEAIFLGDTKQKDIYLTFDNGYENGYTAKILDVLRDKKVPTIFFITGHYVKDQPELVQRMVSEGHLVGNHSWSHPDVTTISNEQLKNELLKVKTAVADITNQKEMAYVRAPRGIFNESMLAESRAEGYTNVFWSVAYKDWDPATQKGSEYAYTQVMKQLHPGAVILLHSVSKDNTEAMGRIIDDARKQGYEFKSLTQMQCRTY